MPWSAIAAILLLMAILPLPRTWGQQPTDATSGAIAAPTNASLPPPPEPACAVTAPNGVTRPGRQPVADGHANDVLWTLLWPEGRVVFEPGGPGFILPDGSLGMKWPWVPVAPGELPLVPEDLSITGRRLDGPAPPLRAQISTGTIEYGYFFFPSYLIFATPGCWEVTGRLGQESLTFVTLVVLEGEGPEWRPSSLSDLS
jgi:hypothetical protein